MLSYNVHALLHLSGECLRYGALDSFSAFKFENALKCLKLKIRGGNLTLEQFEKRLSENNRTLDFFVSREAEYKFRNSEGPRVNIRGDQFHKVIVGGMAFSNDICDSHIVDRDEKFYRIVSIVRTNDQPFFICKKFVNVRSFLTRPIDSLELGIARVSRLSSELRVINLQAVLRKCVALPYRHDVVALPLTSLQMFHA